MMAISERISFLLGIAPTQLIRRECVLSVGKWPTVPAFASVLFVCSLGNADTIPGIFKKFMYLKRGTHIGKRFSHSPLVLL